MRNADMNERADPEKSLTCISTKVYPLYRIDRAAIGNPSNVLWPTSNSWRASGSFLTVLRTCNGFVDLCTWTGDLLPLSFVAAFPMHPAHTPRHPDLCVQEYPDRYLLDYWRFVCFTSWASHSCYLLYCSTVCVVITTHQIRMTKWMICFVNRILNFWRTGMYIKHNT